MRNRILRVTPSPSCAQDHPCVLITRYSAADELCLFGHCFSFDNVFELTRRWHQARLISEGEQGDIIARVGTHFPNFPSNRPGKTSQVHRYRIPPNNEVADKLRGLLEAIADDDPHSAYDIITELEKLTVEHPDLVKEVTVPSDC